MNLSEWLRRSPRPPVGEQLSLVVALARAVENGHHSARQYDGWSPAAIEVTSDGSVDLHGIAVESHPAQDLAYIAPEIADGAPPTARSDVYSAGILLYQILAGAHPFGGGSVKQPRGVARPLGELRGDLPQDLSDAVTACLERDPDWRPADLSFVLQVATDAVTKVGSKKAATAAPASRASASHSDSLSFGARPAAASRSPLPLVLAGVFVVVAAGVAYWTFTRLPASPTGHTTPPPVPASPTSPTDEPVTARPVSSKPVTASTRAATAPPVLTPSMAAPAASPIAAARSLPPAIPSTVALPTTAAVVPTRSTPEPVLHTPAPEVTATVATAAAHTVTDAPASAEPSVLISLSPLKLRRGANALLDVRGRNLRLSHTVAIVRVKGRGDATDVVVLRKKLVDGALLQVLVSVAANAPTGLYTLTLSDEQGPPTNALSFEIVS